MNEIQYDALIVAGERHVQTARVGLGSCTELILVFDGVAHKDLSFRVDNPIQAPFFQNGILRGTRAGIQRSQAGCKRRGRKLNHPLCRSWNYNLNQMDNLTLGPHR